MDKEEKVLLCVSTSGGGSREEDSRSMVRWFDKQFDDVKWRWPSYHWRFLFLSLQKVKQKVEEDFFPYPSSSVAWRRQGAHAPLLSPSSSRCVFIIPFAIFSLSHSLVYWSVCCGLLFLLLIFFLSFFYKVALISLFSRKELRKV